MRKFLLLCLGLGLALSGNAQKETVFYETFDQPSGADSVTSGFTQASNSWSTTTLVSTSPNQSYTAKSVTGGAATVFFETDPFSTVGKPFVVLSFDQIAKIYLLSQAFVHISTDGGNTWQRLKSQQYTGSDKTFQLNGYFNSGSHQNTSNIGPWKRNQPGATPANSWWRTETFDLTGLASDTVNKAMTGYPDVRLKFEMVTNSVPPSGQFPAGWFVDNILVEAGTCEVTPPDLTFSYNPSPQCYPVNPQGPLVADIVDSSYVMGIAAADASNRFDTGIDSVVFYYRIDGGAWQQWTLRKTQEDHLPYYTEYIDTLKFAQGDTVDYYFMAWDLGCPNVTRLPSVYENNGYYTFHIEFNLPTKCGNSVCDKYPEVIDANTLWAEDFDDNSQWKSGGGANGPRGDFPIFPDGAWQVLPPFAGNPSSPNGWSINSGSTPTDFTGPDHDHTLGAGGGGQYVYYEFPGGSPVVSWLNTPCIDLTTTTSCKAFEFYYHMFGQDIGNLYVAVDTGSDSQAWDQNIWVVKGEQHSSGTDEWNRAIVPLEDYNGQIIRLGLIAVPENPLGNSGPRADVAVDDLRIYEPDPVEFEVLGTTYPLEGYCAYGMEPVHISIRNNGCVTAMDIPIAYSINNGPPVRDTITNANLVLGQDTIDYVFDDLADMTNAPDIYNIAVWVEDPMDSDNSNDTAYGPTIEHNVVISNFPYVEDFENADPVTNALNNNDLRYMDGLDPFFYWKVGTRMTPTRGTGPFRGHGNEGNYLYVQSDFSDDAVSTYLRTICIDLSSLSNPTLDFLYHNLTDNQAFDKVVVEVSKELEDLGTWTEVQGSTISSGAGFNNEFSDWKLKRINLGADYAGQSIKIRFKATRKASGTDSVNFAIDNIVVYDPLVQDGGILSIENPDMNKRGTVDENFQPSVSVINYGSGTLNDFTVNMELTPLCGPNAGQSTVYNQSYTGQSIAAAQNKTVTMDNINISWPESECRLCFYTTVSGDNYTFNDTVCKNFVVRSTHQIVEQYPNDHIYFEDYFDQCNYSRTGWYADGGLLQWELGSPVTGVAANSQPNSWVTNLYGPYLTGTTEYLYLPKLSNFDTIVGAELRFMHKFNFGGGSSGVYDAAGTIEYKDPDNGTYTVLGSEDISYAVNTTHPERGTRNWWLSKYGTLSIDLFNDRPGWIGNSQNQYIPSHFDLGEFNRDTNDLDLRFTFKSKPMYQSQATFGWSIDDFRVFVPAQNSAGPANVHTLQTVAFPGEEQHFRVKIQNTGAKILDSVTVDIYLDGVHLGTHKEVFQNSGPGARPFIFEENRVIDSIHFAWPANLVTPGAHEVCVITSRPNGKQDNSVSDDTLCKTISVLQEYDLTSIGDSSYCNDFEGTDPSKFRWITARVERFSDLESSWNDGISLQFDSAHSGASMWMTDLYEDYENLDNSALYTPLFHVDSGQTYKIDFWHRFETEKFHDGGNVEMSFDGGKNWYHLGYSIRGKDNWYNTSFVTSLEQIKGGWTDSSDGWINAWQRIAFKEDVEVVFRFRFAADYSITYPGWAIDDFCFYKRSGPTDLPEIGGDEFILPEEINIGELAPNPAWDKTELVFNFPTPNNMNVKVYNVVGQLIEKRSNHYQEGIHKLSFDTSRWKNGVYLINLEYGEGMVVTRKLVVSH